MDNRQDEWDDWRDQLIRREWGYDREPVETCCDCARPLGDVEDTARKIAVPLSWADCLIHPGDRHHLLPCEMYRKRP